jgi:transposase, IS30 family
MAGRWPAAVARRRQFWRLISIGASTRAAALAVGVSAGRGQAWFRDSGGMPPLDLGEPSGRYLSAAEREEIALARASGLTVRAIARQIGRAPSTISRELRRNAASAGPHRCSYRARLAQHKAEARARRPKPGKLALMPRLREAVQDMLDEHFSPQQIAGRLPRLYPNDSDMRISHEAIYQSLYIYPRGLLRRDLTQRLRTGRALRKPRRRVDGRSRPKIPDMVMIADRPAEVEDRAIPGDWEGDLILGANNKSAIGTLVERKYRYVLLLHLPNGHGADAVQAAITTAMATLPHHLRRSLTWDQGVEMANHGQISIDADLAIYFCDPHSPWQRGTNENTNGLLRQYFPKGTDLSQHSAAHLAAVSAQLNARPRKALDYSTPAELMAPLLQTGCVATTT